ncbi:hypothetical protein ASD24_18010 [Paenibacillus sp. Root52]|uniref:hypothetical protein n=1 Tax=Paenibacillus sp. Root52 TaxID=1736552 RepID=UPI0006FC6191|nr:hypothetical protein [Paenibacillus sp. Root52]KQY79843.1 hypothetical protein ASD24_18010 [Paenibacillus sp. Root52]
MKPEVIALRCPSCKDVSEPLIRENAQFNIVGYEDIMEWLDEDGDVPGLDEQIWARSDSIPVKGQMRTVKVHHPFYMVLGKPFWVLYTPALSSLNGWDSHPEEIDQSAFIQCYIDQVLVEGESEAWIQIHVHEVLLLTELQGTFPPREVKESYLESFEMFNDPYIVQYQDWTWISAGSQGNIGVWALIKRYQEQYHMLVYGDWDIHSNNAYGGNAVVPDDRIEGWIQQAMKNQRYEHSL